MLCDVRTKLHVKKLRVYMLNDKDGQPIMLQVRATETIQKGQLVLSPAGGDVVLMDTKKKLAKTGVIHPSMLTHVLMNVKGAVAKPRHGILGVEVEQEPDFDEFAVRSPAMTRGASKLAPSTPSGRSCRTPRTPLCTTWSGRSRSSLVRASI